MEREIWTDASRDLHYCEILFQFKITVFYMNIFSNVIYSCDDKAEAAAIHHIIWIILCYMIF